MAAVVGLVPFWIAICCCCWVYQFCRSSRAWLYIVRCFLSIVVWMVLYVIGGRSGRTCCFSLRM